MKIIPENGPEITIELDSDGFPIVSIDTGSDFLGENNRPTVEVRLNDVVIHGMFSDDRDGNEWKEEDIVEV